MTSIRTSIRVLIVDDSSFMRTAIASMLRDTTDIEVVGTASNGKEAIEKANQLKPDIITMDIEMPIMTGIEALKEIMNSMPTPVIMISTLTTEGAQATMEALSYGAADFIPKQTNFAQLSLQQFRQDLLDKVRALAKSPALKLRHTTLQAPTPGSGEGKRLTLQERIQQRLNRPANKTPSPTGSTNAPANKTRTITQTTGKSRPHAAHFKIAVLGVSTGGPLALQQVIPLLPAKLPVALLIVQHMPAHFTKSLADRLNTLSQITVKEAQDMDALTPGTALIAPGGRHMVIGRDKRSVRIVAEPASALHKPCVDVTVESVVDMFGGHALGIIMTGMGRDGTNGLKMLHKKGGYIIAQDEETSIVYGMPKAVVDEGIADDICPLENLASTIAAALGAATA